MMHARIDILSELGKPHFQEIAKSFQTKSYPRKTLMFLPKGEEDAVFIITKGRARIYLAYEDKEFTLAILERGDVYSTHTRAFVSALEDTEVLLAATPNISRQFLRTPEFTGTMVRVLAELLSHSIGIIDNLAFLDVENRLRSFLRFEASRSQSQGQGVLLDLGLTTEHLASLLGTTRQTLSTMLNSLAREGVIELKRRGAIFIPDPAALG